MIYLDNAATTWPKPPEVAEEMQRVLTQTAGNPSRGLHSVSIDVSRLVYDVRESIAKFFGASDPKRVIFTGNATHALNLALFGLLKPGDHVIKTSLEHNAVTRPIRVLAERGVEVSEFVVHPEQELAWDDFEAAFKRNTKLVVTTHASNVTGTILPVEQIGKVVQAHGAFYLVDAAQTAGVFSIDLNQMPIDLLAFPGHKGLLGPQGTGGLIVGPKVTLEPLIYGGTGSWSETDQQPDFLPDALESGTLNVVGIAGLGAGIKYLQQNNVREIRRQEQTWCQILIDGLRQIPGIKIYGGINAAEKAPIVAFNLGNIDSMTVGYLLDKEAGIIARAGLHCAPSAHKTIGTLKQGVVRLSPSHFTAREDIEITLSAVRQVAKELLGE